MCCRMRIASDHIHAMKNSFIGSGSLCVWDTMCMWKLIKLITHDAMPVELFELVKHDTQT